MTRNTRARDVSRLAGLALLSAGWLITGACQSPREPGATSEVAAALAAGESALDPLSVYQLEGQWVDQQGRERTLADLRGRPQVVAMVYTHCGYTCPQILLDMKRIEAGLRGTEGGFVMVSIDPARDTPERLAEFAGSARLDPARWTLLTGAGSRTLELAMLLGVSYRPEGLSDLSHSNALIVLDGEGRVVLRQDGLDRDPAAILEVMGRG